MQPQRDTLVDLGPPKATQAMARLSPVIHTAHYDVTALAFETARQYDADLRFGPVFAQVEAPCPAEYLASAIEDALVLSLSLQRVARPIHVAAPLAALLHPETPAACTAAVRRARGCPQEICLDFDDAAFTADSLESVAAIRRLRSVGLRVGIDARASWCATTSVPLRMLIDTIHVRAGDLRTEIALAERVSVAAKEGIAVVAHRARWRDAPELHAMGVDYISRAKADA